MFEIQKYGVTIIVTVLLLMLESMITCGWKAFENMKEADLKKMKEEDEKRADKLQRVKQQLEMYTTFLPILITSINLCIGFFYGKRIIYWADYCTAILCSSSYAWILRKVFQVIGMLFLVYVVVLFGVMVPGKLALKASEKKAGYLCGLFSVLIGVFCIAAKIVEKSVTLIFFLIGKNTKEYQDLVTEEEIISIVNEGLEQGVLEDAEVEMIANIIEMDDKEVKDIMTRRKNIVAIDGAMGIEEALDIMLMKNYSRYPIYEGDIDNITGIVFLKDVTRYFIQNRSENIRVGTLAKKAYCVPDTQKINQLFEKMQSKKIHMAIAIDEYGQTAGIVAMEDVLEEIVGNIYDEFDVDERMIIKQREDKYFMRGLAPLEEVAMELGIDLGDELQDYDTLNGFLISRLGHIPSEKEKVNILYQNYEFRVVDIKNNMIRFVRVHKETEQE